MNDNWNWRDEVLRAVDAYSQKPPSITQLLDLFDQVVPPASRKGWAGITDDPHAPPSSPPSTKEASMASSNYVPVTLFKCPACQNDISGTVALKQAETQPDIDLTSPSFVVHMVPAGVRVQHDCVPKVTRSA